MTETDNGSRAQQLLKKIQAYPGISAIVVTGTVIIAIASFTDAVSKLWTLVGGYVEVQEPPFSPKALGDGCVSVRLPRGETGKVAFIANPNMNKQFIKHRNEVKESDDVLSKEYIEGPTDYNDMGIDYCRWEIENARPAPELLILCPDVPEFRARLQSDYEERTFPSPPPWVHVPPPPPLPKAPPPPRQP